LIAVGVNDETKDGEDELGIRVEGVNVGEKVGDVVDGDVVGFVVNGICTSS